MKKHLSIRLAIALALSAFATTRAQAELLLLIDLSVVNQLKITATTGNSAATSSGSDSDGFYLEGFFNSTVTATIGGTRLSGDLTHFENTSDNSPELWRTDNNDPGLNLYSYTGDVSSTFTTGNQAFTGSGTWELDSAAYALALAGSGGGNIYFTADAVSNIAGADLIGEWVVVPESSSFAYLLGVFALSVSLIRRRK